MAVTGISGPVQRITIIEPQRADRQIQAYTNAEIGSKAVECAFRHQWIEWQFVALCIVEACLLVEAGRTFQGLVPEIPCIRIDQTSIVKYRSPGLFNNGKSQFHCRAGHRLTPDG